MIISRIMGGLGNQMFQYALGWRLASQRDGILKLDLSWFELQEKRKFELDQFNIRASIANRDYIRELIPFSSNRIIRGIWRRIDEKLPDNMGFVYREKQTGHFDPQVLHVKNRKYLDGYWHSEKYFKDVKNEILTHFTLKQPLSDVDQALANEMSDNPYSVSVHVRRGDYVSEHRLIRSHYICTPDYYNETMHWMNKKFDGKAIFYIFSDDPDWCRTGLEYPSEYKIVSDNIRSNPVELVLMSHCRNAIIANSSFSWWGAWLIDNPDKIVLHPKNWFNHHAAPDIAAEGWIAYQHDTSNDWKYIDIPYAKSRYREQYQRELNLDNPRAFSEKLQWMKIYDRNPLYTILSDKYAARHYAAERIGNDYLPMLFGVYDSSQEIDWKSLPDQFVLKANQGSRRNIFCRDKRKIDIRSVSQQLDTWLKQNYYYNGREWSYKDVQPKIICEEYLQGESSLGLADYKFFCFNGKVKLIQVDVDRYIDHKRAIFDPYWNLQPFTMNHPLPDKVIPRPSNLDEMAGIALTLADGFHFIRVDLYSFSGHIYFGEFAIYPEAGFPHIVPAEYDFTLGKEWQLPQP
jgi:hypothetical protein